MAGDKPNELVAQAVIRGRLCETLAAATGLAGRSQDLFLMGLFSLIDAILDRPLEEIVNDLPLAEDVQDALLGDDSVACRILDLVRSHEHGDWVRAGELTAGLGLEPTLRRGGAVGGAGRPPGAAPAAVAGAGPGMNRPVRRRPGPGRRA